MKAGGGRKETSNYVIWWLNVVHWYLDEIRGLHTFLDGFPGLEQSSFNESNGWDFSLVMVFLSKRHQSTTFYALWFHKIFDCCFEFLTQNWECLSSWNRKKREQSFFFCSLENYNCLFWETFFLSKFKRQTLPVNA